MVSEGELAEAFTPTDEEIEWARGRTRDTQHLLVLLVWLKSFQRLGYFPKLVDVPEVVAAHLRGALELPAGTVLEQDAERTAKRHRQWVRGRLGVTYEPARVRDIAERAIRDAVQTKDNPADLINVALEELVRARCELPGYTTLDAMASTIRAEVNTCDEFPMASTNQGAALVADGDWSSRDVLKSANDSQGGIISSSNDQMRLLDGDQFLVFAELGDGRTSWD